MTAARRFFLTRFHPGALADLIEIELRSSWVFDCTNQELIRIKARRDEADPKRGRLEGCLSHSFKADPEDRDFTGRIVYKVDGLVLWILAVHPDHDEAYRRARARLRRLG